MAKKNDRLGMTLMWLGLALFFLAGAVDIVGFFISDGYWKVVALTIPIWAAGILCFVVVGKRAEHEHTRGRRKSKV